MGKYFVRRLLLLIPTIIIVCVIVFALMRMVPGSAVEMMVYRMNSAGIAVDAEAVERMLGMDKPAVQQFFLWVWDLLHGDLGDSLFQYESVWNCIARQLPVSLELGIITLILTNLISIPLGLYCAARQDSISDYVLRIISVVLMSIPTFWVASLVLVWPAVWWGYAPPATYASITEDFALNMRMFLVPALVGAIMQAGMQLRMVRTSVLDVMRQDYIRTAWAKGVKERVILFKHAFRNSMIPVITMIGGSVGGLIGGSVIMETLFNIPGIGNQLVTALNQRDYPVVQGCVLIFSLFVMFVNILVDMAYKWIDPRVELE